MKLKDYAKHIAELAKKHPNMEVAYASDEEGNSHHMVMFKPSLGKVEIDGEEVGVILVN